MALLILAPKLNLSQRNGPPNKEIDWLEMIDKILLSQAQKWTIIKRLFHLCNLEREAQATLPTRALREKDQPNQGLCPLSLR